MKMEHFYTYFYGKHLTLNFWITFSYLHLVQKKPCNKYFITVGNKIESIS
jgi:hypothetical protein